jgi:hypothetical protein
MHAHREGNLAVVMVVVADEFLDDVLAGIHVDLVVVTPFNGLKEDPGRPAVERVVNRLAGRLPIPDQFWRRAYKGAMLTTRSRRSAPQPEYTRVTETSLASASIGFLS